MSDFTLLTVEQCLGSDIEILVGDQLDILRKRGAIATVTDFCIILGCSVIHNDSIGNTGYYWTKSDDGRGNGYAIRENATSHWLNPLHRRACLRPVLPFSTLDSIPINGESFKRAEDDILEVEYGYYPQEAVSRTMQLKLEHEFRSSRLIKTGNFYTTDSQKCEDYGKNFEPIRHEEYQYNKKRYAITF